MHIKTKTAVTITLLVVSCVCFVGAMLFSKEQPVPYALLLLLGIEHLAFAAYNEQRKSAKQLTQNDDSKEKLKELAKTHMGLLTLLSSLRNRHLELGHSLDQCYLQLGSMRYDPKLQDLVFRLKRALREVKEWAKQNKPSQR